jgi:molybdopterin-guanine dinucleotide biosynthesis protein A
VRVAGIVLAGGRSSRFGSPKLSAELEGRSLLDHAIEAVAGLATETLVVLSPDAPAPTLPPNIRIVRDPEAFGGPLIGLAAALEVTTALVAVVVGGDMPRVRPEVLELMLAELRHPSRPAAVVLADSSGRRPLPLVLGISARAPLATVLQSGERSLRGFLDRLHVLVVQPEEWRRLDPEGDTLIDVDRPEDLERVRASDPGERGLP